LISLWHVLEHLHDPNEFLGQLKKHLESDGKIFIAVPNFRSYYARYYKEFWAAYDVPRHLYHFQQKDISKLFIRKGFKLEKVIPMRFDSYYVSMLSEKYKKRFSLFGFVIGFISNLKSKKHGYSSQVYVFEKS
jgi:2-polyprenyl-3-methyl-5-hydroxy-6-metoxy-1,4-benzoquinol methylase